MQILYGAEASEVAALAASGGGAQAPDVSEPAGSAPSGVGNAASAFNEPGVGDSSGVSDLGGTAQIPADPNQRAGMVPTQAPAPTQWQSIRDAATAAGFQFGADITDDRQALNFLLQRAQASRQQNVYEQLGRQLAPKAEQVLGYLRGTPGQGVPVPAAAERPSWEAPEFDERWVNCVDRDPGTGLFVAKPGFPPELAQKVNTFVEWKAKFDRNPASVMNAMVEAKAKEIAQKTYQEQFALTQRDQTVRNIVTENEQWMYQRDQAGNPLRSFDGNMVVTPVGARYVHHLRQIASMGVTDPAKQDAFAKQLVRGEYAQAWAAQQSAAAAQGIDGQTANAAQGGYNVNPLQTQSPLARRRNPAATEPSAEGKSIAEMLREDFEAEGISNLDILSSQNR